MFKEQKLNYVVLLVLTPQGYTAPTLQSIIIFAVRQIDNWERASSIFFIWRWRYQLRKNFADFNWTSLI